MDKEKHHYRLLPSCGNCAHVIKKYCEDGCSYYCNMDESEVKIYDIQSSSTEELGLMWKWEDENCVSQNGICNGWIGSLK